MNIKLKMKILSSGKTQREIATLLKIPETRLSEYVQEVKEVPVEIKTSISQLLGCEEGEIF